MNEARIVVNGKQLTAGQSMAVRVACGAFMLEMVEPNALGDDHHGRLMAEAYKDRLGEVVSLMVAE